MKSIEMELYRNKALLPADHRIQQLALERVVAAGLTPTPQNKKDAMAGLVEEGVEVSQKAVNASFYGCPLRGVPSELD